jgi:glycosyltransferase involved in cell wall biosynthesis
VRIAVLCQPIDRVLPPGQNSIGFCTWAFARALADQHEVSVFGSGARNESRDGVRFEMLERWGSPLDRRLRRLQRLLYVPRRDSSTGPPISSTTLPYVGFRRAVVRRVVAARPDLVVVQNHTQYLPALKRNLPSATLVVILHNAIYSQVRHRQMLRRLRCADVVAGVSQYVVDGVARRYPTVASRCTVVGAAIDPDDFVALEAPTSARRIVYCGVVSPPKGVHVLLEAAVPLLDADPTLTLDVYGSTGYYALRETVDADDRDTLAALRPWYGDYGSRLVAAVPERLRERVHLRGAYERAALGGLIAGATVAALPSVGSEAFPLRALEVMATGVPVVVSDSGGMPETVVDGVTGLVVPRGDAVRLREALARVIRDDELRSRLVRTARADVLANRTWRGAADRVLGAAHSSTARQPRTVIDPAQRNR